MVFTIAHVWIATQALTLMAAVAGLIGSFRNPALIILAFFPSTVSHLLRIYLIRLPFTLNSLKMNFSAHVIAINLLFYCVGGFTRMWVMVLGLSSFLQVLWFVASILKTETVQPLYRWLDQTNAGSQALALSEIWNLLTLGGAGLLPRLLRSQGYLFGYVLYRYATDPAHQRLWASYRLSFTRFVTKLPAVISGLLLKIPQSFESFGMIGLSLYSGPAT
jgi:hypothetical protein